jgi:hypothetical protein
MSIPFGMFATCPATCWLKETVLPWWGLVKSAVAVGVALDVDVGGVVLVLLDDEDVIGELADEDVIGELADEDVIGELADVDVIGELADVDELLPDWQEAASALADNTATASRNREAALVCSGLLFMASPLFAFRGEHPLALAFSGYNP